MAWLSLLVAIALIWWLMKLGRGALFEIRLAPGKVQVKRGKVSPAFIEQARQILRHETVRGRILGQRDGDGVKLVFSRSIPEPVAQRFRNIFPYGDYRLGRCRSPAPNHARGESSLT
ncbi:DUF3634 family protein [Aeromonas hydrophila]|uniref:DUF3634 family protein n=1 Tax=Aeromonas hydrophila TaxID=644 RepID=UPI001B39E378|nr:DUF3634 family protein [Aeromonas hydrophila]MBQ4677756.1 DUF3634 family protein [Aeromonas hydrophila]MBW3814898.1 DUF3634 family protein [Aeromonas hydrophila]MCF7677592.1 DUF3634 family protein [Aeromonas hydrophila]MCF7690395.1 DUF3634 family protein [Aeromonas hydrophila]MCF7775481.1 DUF3634 family protein [Aeromonas hydrophila]